MIGTWGVRVLDLGSRVLSLGLFGIESMKSAVNIRTHGVTSYANVNRVVNTKPDINPTLNPKPNLKLPLQAGPGYCANGKPPRQQPRRRA